MRRVDEYVGKSVMVMDVPRKKWKGRLKLNWMDSIKHDLTENGSSDKEAHYWAAWK